MVNIAYLESQLTAFKQDGRTDIADFESKLIEFKSKNFDPQHLENLTMNGYDIEFNLVSTWTTIKVKIKEEEKAKAISKEIAQPPEFTPPQKITKDYLEELLIPSRQYLYRLFGFSNCTEDQLEDARNVIKWELNRMKSYHPDYKKNCERNIYIWRKALIQ